MFNIAFKHDVYFYIHLDLESDQLTTAYSIYEK